MVEKILTKNGIDNIIEKSTKWLKNLFCKGDRKMTAQEKSAQMIEALEAQGYCMRDLAELLRSLNMASIKIQQGNDENSEIKLRKRITSIIKDIGVPANVKGYQYIRTSIMLAYENPNYMDAVIKVLYPSVAKKYDTTASKVERAIRHAIEVTWNRGEIDTLQRYFGYYASRDKEKPTNSEFIASLVD